MVIDVEALRHHLSDLAGTAVFSGFEAALLDLADIELMDGVELCRHAETLGVDLARFEVPSDPVRDPNSEGE